MAASGAIFAPPSEPAGEWPRSGRGGSARQRSPQQFSFAPRVSEPTPPGRCAGIFPCRDGGVVLTGLRGHDLSADPKSGALRMTSRTPAFAADILALFAKRGAELTDVAIVQPADPFLDMAGEDLRRRIFLTESETGEALCLRPEFTIPVCLDHIESRAGTPRRYAYLGEVFRQRRDGRRNSSRRASRTSATPTPRAADARSVADAHALLRTAPARRGPDRDARRPGNFRGGAGGPWPAARLAHAARPRLRLA